MPSPKQIYDAVVRALERETDPDPNPGTPTGPNARLSAFSTVNPDIHDASGRNRDHKFPGIDVTLERKRRLDEGDAFGEWTGEFEYDDKGQMVGRIFSKFWRVTLQLSVVMWAGDTDHTITGLDGDLESVLSRFDTNVRGDFLLAEDGTPLQNIKSIADEGGEMGRGSSSIREYDHEATIEFEEIIYEREEFGPTPTINNVLYPRSDEHHAAPETSPGDVVGDVPQERIDIEPTLQTIATDDTATISANETEQVYGTLDHDGTLEQDGTLTYLDG